MPTGSRKKSAFVVLVRPDTGAVYMVINTSGQYGTPGGTGEETDTNAFAVACREFEEETGSALPYTMWLYAGGTKRYITYGHDSFYDYVTYGDCYCDCYFYYKIVPPEIADTLNEGPSPDPCRSEVFVGWYRPSDVWGSLRPHVREGIKMVQARSRAVASLIMPGRRPRPHKGGRERAPSAAKSSQPAFAETLEGLEELLASVSVNA